jgi:fructuronate reductase
VRDDTLAGATRRLLYGDVLPTLAAPDGLDLPDYCEQLMARFANPNLRHSTSQVAMDGSQKLPNRILGTISDRLAAGATPQSAVLVVAAWMAYVARAATGESGLPLDDPLRDRLATAAVSAGDDPRALVVNLLQIRDIFGDELSQSVMFRDLLVDQLAEARSLSRR